MKRQDILGLKVDPITFEEITNKVISWANSNQSKYICFANVHMVMESYDSPNFRKIVNEADIVSPDGMPLVWMLKVKGFKGQNRVSGPETTIRICKEAANKGIPVGFYGSSEEVLEKLTANLIKMFPSLKVACAISPPYRELTEKEDYEYTKLINSSGARVLFVGLGCPKQEKWMNIHKDKINAVMLGVGAAFDFHAGSIKVAPKWMQNLGLEWFYRLLQDPRRLWKRYAKHNPRFIILGLIQLFREAFQKKGL
ncbi:WecB/TagA/CpsF family glycosyltransferase [Bacillus alveayuensis]|uniref:WecB/TagA/CpsF family glycosyltransferase n=1 Tax=Aeribacillus alveayuensis TaxID=279215 RepID=UPI000A5820B0|nr:WecB/TagA/CpsF family glycosyltransferase [Bacillus alveayuensis]